MKRILLTLLVLTAPVTAYARSISGDLTEDGDTSSLTCNSGIILVAAEGTWGSGTLTAYYLDGDGNYEEIRVSGTAKTWTADFTENLDMSGPTTFKFTLSGASGPDLDYDLRCSIRR